jgi:hypothetical protein
MEILIPGALPPSPIAPELVQYLETACPLLIERFQSLDAQTLSLNPNDTGCTPLEAIELKRAGFEIQAPHNLSAGLGPLKAGVQKADEPVWIAELASVAIRAEGPSLIHPDALAITQSESDALFDAVAELWVGTGISALSLNQTQWRIWLPVAPVLNSISPRAIAGLALADWWSQHESLRGWRKLLNEIQMVWHAHPVNLARTARGLPPINSLWLYGGAKGWKPSTADSPLLFSDLVQAHQQSDWGTWINTLPALASFMDAQPADVTLTLLGQQHGIQLTAAKRAWWHRVLPAKKQNWKSWWNLQN